MRYDSLVASSTLMLAEQALKCPTLRDLRYGLDNPDAISNVRVHRRIEGRYIFQDSYSGQWIKVHGDICDGVLQQRVMNGLYAQLARAGCGVSAVRHLVLLDGRVSVIEPADGEPVVAMHDRRAHTAEARKRLGRALGPVTSRLVVNDLDRGGSNLYLGPDGDYTIIDQPLVGGKTHFRASLGAACLVLK